MYQFRVVFVGDHRSGKTSIIRRLVSSKRVPYEETTVESPATKIFDIDNTSVKLQLWDTPGEMDMLTVTRSDFRHAQCIVITYDTCVPASLDNALHWVKEIDRFCGRPLPIKVLLGCKSDKKSQSSVPKEKANEIASNMGMMYAECSAQEGVGVDATFRKLAIKCMDRVREKNNDSVAPKKRSDSSEGSCCTIS